MTHIPHATKIRIFLGACAAWLAAGVWLVGCVVAEAPVRVTIGAGLSVVLLAVAVAVVKHDLELEAARRIAEAGMKGEPVFFDPRERD